MREDKLEKVLLDCYEKAFKEAFPSSNVYKIMASGEDKKDNFFLNYYLDIKRQEEIVNEVCKKYKLNKQYCKTISVNYFLGWCPSSNKHILERKYWFLTYLPVYGYIFERKLIRIPSLLKTIYHIVALSAIIGLIVYNRDII